MRIATRGLVLGRRFVIRPRSLPSAGELACFAGEVHKLGTIPFLVRAQSLFGEAEDGTTGLQELRRLRPDVVLLDVQLPDMTGFDVCIECGDLDTTSVVLVSSRDATDYGSLIASSGARGFIAKADLSGDAVVDLLK